MHKEGILPYTGVPDPLILFQISSQISFLIHVYERLDQFNPVYHPFS